MTRSCLVGVENGPNSPNSVNGGLSRSGLVESVLVMNGLIMIIFHRRIERIKKRSRRRGLTKRCKPSYLTIKTLV